MAIKTEMNTHKENGNRKTPVAVLVVALKR
jgi:hypothetical protein